MPQIWLTYDELAEHFRGSGTEAREQVIAAGWDRRRSRDGLTRVKLPPATAIEYMRALARCFEASVAGSATDEQVAHLRTILGLMRRDPEVISRAATA